MKFSFRFPTALLSLAIAGFSVLHAESAKPKALPYPLKTCAVSGEELNAPGGMQAYSFVEDGQEVKLCCKSCLKDFNKDKSKFMKKIRDAAKGQR